VVGSEKIRNSLDMGKKKTKKGMRRVEKPNKKNARELCRYQEIPLKGTT